MENKVWDFMKYKNKVLFYQDKTGKSHVRNFAYENVKPLYREDFAYKTDGLYLVKFGRQYAIYNANVKSLSRKFDRLVFSHDYTNFVVEKHSFSKKYQTIYNKYSNRFVDLKGSEIVRIANSDAFRVFGIKGIPHGAQARYKIFDSKKQIVYGEFGFVSSEALLGYVYVRDEAGWSSPAYILNLETGEKIEDAYHDKLYKTLQVNQDEDSVDKMSSALSTFSYEHLFYCLPELKKEHEDLLICEQQEHKKQKLVAEKQIAMSIKRHCQPKRVASKEELTGSQPGEE